MLPEGSRPRTKSTVLNKLITAVRAVFEPACAGGPKTAYLLKDATEQSLLGREAQAAACASLPFRIHFSKSDKARPRKVPFGARRVLVAWAGFLLGWPPQVKQSKTRLSGSGYHRYLSDP